MIEVFDLSKSFRKVMAVREMRLSVPEGSIFSLLGPNGAGKTTLMKMLLGVVRPDAGHVRLQGLPADSPLSRRGVRYLPENITFPRWASPKLLFRQMERVRKEVTMDLFLARCEELECGELLGRPSGKMSRGQRQRAALALVTCGNPSLVLLDEPSTGLDPGGRILVRNLVDRLASKGTTVLINSHLLGEVERVCDTAAFMSRGRLLAEGELGSLTRLKGTALVETAFPEEMMLSLESSGYPCRRQRGGVLAGLEQDSDFERLVEDVLAATVPFTGVILQRENLEDVFMRVMADDGGKEVRDVHQRS